MNSILPAIKSIKAIKISKFYLAASVASRDFKTLEAAYDSDKPLDTGTLADITSAVNTYYDLFNELSELDNFDDVEPNLLPYFNKAALQKMFGIPGALLAASDLLDALEERLDELGTPKAVEPAESIPDKLIVEPSEADTGDEDLTLPKASEVELTNPVSSDGEGIQFDTPEDYAQRKKNFLQNA